MWQFGRNKKKLVNVESKNLSRMTNAVHIDDGAVYLKLARENIKFNFNSTCGHKTKYHWTNSVN